MDMKLYIALTLLLVFVWLALLAVQLSAGEYPRRRIVQRFDDAAKAILLIVFWLIGFGILNT